MTAGGGELYELLDDELPQVDLVVSGLDNWIDAGFGVAGALRTLREGCLTRVIARFDVEELVDHQARRPVLELVDGVTVEVRFPELDLTLATLGDGSQFLLLSGPEPDRRWRRFAAQVIDLAGRCGARRLVSLGAYPAPTPHTRPTKVVTTGTSTHWAQRVGHIPGRLEVPASAGAALEVACRDRGLEAVGLWAQVPHYVANYPYPAASLALLDNLALVTGTSIDRASLAEARDSARQELDRLVARNPEHAQMIEQLEAQFDGQLDAVGLPTADELGAELEQFLRHQSPETDS